MKLSYHAQVYEYTPRPIRDIKPQAINWQFQRPSEMLDSTFQYQLSYCLCH
jgi:hypothetical protein